MTGSREEPAAHRSPREATIKDREIELHEFWMMEQTVARGITVALQDGHACEAENFRFNLVTNAQGTGRVEEWVGFANALQRVTLV